MQLLQIFHGISFAYFLSKARQQRQRCHADRKCVAATPCPRETNVERVDTEGFTLSAGRTRMSTTKLDEFRRPGKWQPFSTLP